MQLSRRVDQTRQIVEADVVVFRKNYIFIRSHDLQTSFVLADLSLSRIQ